MDKKYQMKSLADADVQQQLKNASPLDMVQTLQSIELHNQQSSIKVIDEIYKEFEGGGSTVETLLKPLLISVVDSGLAKTPILQSKKSSKSGSEQSTQGKPASDLLSGAVIWDAIMDFSYEREEQIYAANQRKNDPHPSELSIHSTRQESARNGQVTSYNRDDYVNNVSNDGKGGGQRKFTDETFKKSGFKRVHSEADGSYAYKGGDAAGNGVKVSQQAQADHIVSLSAAHKQFSSNLVVNQAMVRHAVDNPDVNLQWATQSYNNAKSDLTAQEIEQGRDRAIEKKKNGETLNKREQKLSSLSEEQVKKIKLKEAETLEKIEDHIADEFWGRGTEDDPSLDSKKEKEIRDKREENRKKNLEEAKEKTKAFAKDEAFKEALRMGVSELIKVSVYEIKDLIVRGSKISFKERIKRIERYLTIRAWPAIKESFESVFLTIAKELLHSFSTVLKGLFRKFARMVSEGLHAIVAAVKILKKPASEMTAAQKSDALLKLFIATVSPMITMLILQLPLGPFEELAEALLGGIVSCLLIWAVDKADIFNTKADRRSQRVKEVFAYRVKEIKSNTDIFDSAATQAFIRQRAAFDGMHKQISDAIDANKPVHELSTNLADFMGVGEKIKIRDTDSFAELLASNRQLTI